MAVKLLQGDCQDVLRTLPDASVHCVVTSPPYFGLRDYGVDGQIGLEATHDCLGWATQQPCGACFVCRMVAVFRDVRRVLRDDGTLWLNLGDSYAGSARGGSIGNKSTLDGSRDNQNETRKAIKSRRRDDAMIPRSDFARPGLKQKDLMMMPARVAMALQADGWYLRQDIIWSKPNPMPESVRDRCTKSHEYIFLLTKNKKYFYDCDAVRTQLKPKTLTTFGTERRALGNDGLGMVKADNYSRTVPVRKPKLKFPPGWESEKGSHGTIHRQGRNETPVYQDVDLAGANLRSVWEISTQGFPEAHFATFPPALIEPCILAGCPGGGIVLDPFGGAGTTGLVADRLGRDAILIELNPAYVEIARRRIENDAPLFAKVEAA